MRLGSEQPFLFYPDGPDVRWRSFATVAEQAEGGRQALEAAGLRAGEAPVVAYAWAGGRPGADGVAADLAIRSAGWTAAPVPVFDQGSARPGVPGGGAGPGDTGEPAPPGEAPEGAGRLLLPWEPQAPDGAAVPRLPEAAREVGRSPGTDRPERLLPTVPGGVLVRGEAGGSAGGSSASGSPSWHLMDAEALGRAAEELGGRLLRDDERPVVAAWLDPSRPSGRVFLEWAITAQVALYLEPERAALGGAASWVRPTVVAGDAWGLATVAAELRRRQGRRGGGGRRHRPPFGRLRQAVLLGPGGLTETDRALLDEHGVALAEVG